MADDQVAAVLEEPLVAQVDRVELEFGVYARLNLAPIPLVLRYGIAVSQALERHNKIVFHLFIDAAEHRRIQITKLQISRLLDYFGTARNEPQLDRRRKTIILK